MERGQIAGLTAELRAQLRLLERVHQRLLERVASGLDPTFRPLNWHIGYLAHIPPCELSHLEYCHI
jgi:hypothetical protein